MRSQPLFHASADAERTQPIRASIRLAIAGLAAVVAMGAMTATAVAAGWQFAQQDADQYYDAAYRDADSNGNIDDLWADLDNDGRWDSHVYNTRGWDNLLETITYDMDENGAPEYRLLDTDQRVGFEYVYVDRNQDRRWDLRRIIPGSSADYLNRVNRYNASNALLHRFRMRTGQSLLFPSFRSPY
jgi:hypothetical protein